MIIVSILRLLELLDGMYDSLFNVTNAWFSGYFDGSGIIGMTYTHPF